MGTSESKHEKETVPSTQSPKEDKYIGLENVCSLRKHQIQIVMIFKKF